MRATQLKIHASCAWARTRRLREQDVLVRVDAAGKQHRRHLARLLRKLRRVLPLGDRVQVDHAVDAVVAVLQRDPVADRAEIVAEMGDAGRLDAGEHALHGRLMADVVRRRKAALSWRRSGEDRTMLTTPGFHHLHLNSIDPDAAIDWYTRQFPSCTEGRVGRLPRAAVAATT